MERMREIDPRRQSGRPCVRLAQAIGEDIEVTGPPLIETATRANALDFNPRPQMARFSGGAVAVGGSAASSTAAGGLLASRKQRRGDRQSQGSKKGSYMPVKGAGS